MLNDIELAQYLNAKFCHELSGCLGAINNGVEFLDNSSPEMRDKAMELVKISAKQSIARLLFYRQAYGIAKFEGEADLEGLKKVIADFLESTKAELNMSIKDLKKPNSYICQNSGKLLLCFIVVANNNLIHGGEIKLDLKLNANRQSIIIIAKGEKLKANEDKIAYLEGNVQDIELSSANIHDYYTYKFMKDLGYELTINQLDEQIEYILSKEIS